MAMQNKNLKTRNEILNTLNETYYVTKRWVEPKEENAYDVYIQPEGGGLDYICTLYVTRSMKKSVEYHGKSFKKVDTLLSEVKKYNDSLMFPIKTYDPMWNKSSQEDYKISSYLTNKLGFTIERGWNEECYELKDDMGKVLTSISYQMDANNGFNKNCDRNCTSGMLMKPYGSHGEYISLCFNDAEDAVRQIETFVAAELSVNVTSGMKVLEKLQGVFSTLENAKITSVEKFLSNSEAKYTDTIIPMLEKLLNTLKNGKD